MLNIIVVIYCVFVIIVCLFVVILCMFLVISVSLCSFYIYTYSFGDCFGCFVFLCGHFASVCVILCPHVIWLPL